MDEYRILNGILEPKDETIALMIQSADFEKLDGRSEEKFGQMHRPEVSNKNSSLKDIARIIPVNKYTTSNRQCNSNNGSHPVKKQPKRCPAKRNKIRRVKSSKSGGDLCMDSPTEVGSVLGPDSKGSNLINKPNIEVAPPNTSGGTPILSSTTEPGHYNRRNSLDERVTMWSRRCSLPSRWTNSNLEVGDNEAEYKRILILRHLEWIAQRECNPDPAIPHLRKMKRGKCVNDIPSDAPHEKKQDLKTHSKEVCKRPLVKPRTIVKAPNKEMPTKKYYPISFYSARLLQSKVCSTFRRKMICLSENVRVSSYFGSESKNHIALEALEALKLRVFARDKYIEHDKAEYNILVALYDPHYECGSPYVPENDLCSEFRIYSSPVKSSIWGVSRTESNIVDNMAVEILKHTGFQPPESYNEKDYCQLNNKQSLHNQISKYESLIHSVNIAFEGEYRRKHTELELRIRELKKEFTLWKSSFIKKKNAIISDAMVQKSLLIMELEKG